MTFSPKTLSFAAILLIIPALAIASPQSGSKNRLSSGGPSSGQGGGAAAGSLFTLGDANKAAESSSVSVDSLARAPHEYDGKTLARRVVVTSEPQDEGGAHTIGVADAETGGRVGPGLHDNGIAFVVESSMAGKLGRKIDPNQHAIVTFTVRKLPAPDHNFWVAIITKVELLGADGSVAKVLE